jgi:cobalt-zinc-cadmium efflux system outer membrane protein
MKWRTSRNRRRHAAWLWALTIISLLDHSLLARAQGQGGEQPLSLEEALSRAEAYAPELVRARNDLTTTEARRTGAGVWLPSNPLTTFLVGSRREAQPDGSALRGIQHQLHVEQALEVAGQRWTRLDAVNAAVAVQRESVEYARLYSRALTKAVYVQCVLVEQRLAVAQHREEVARQILQSAQTRVQLGASGAIEANLARIEVGRVVGDRLEMATERESRLAELRLLTRLPPHTPLRLTTTMVGGTMPQIAVETSVEEKIDQALSLRRDLRAVRSQETQLDMEARRLKREITPNPILAFDYQQDLAGQVFVGGTIGFTLPIFQRNQGPLAQIYAQKRVRQQEENLLATRIRVEVTQALHTLRLRQMQIETFAREALPPSEENVELLRRGWQAGKFDVFRTIAALREMTEVKTRYLTMIEQLWLAGITLERASGVEFLSLPGTTNPAPPR